MLGKIAGVCEVHVGLLSALLHTLFLVSQRGLGAAARG